MICLVCFDRTSVIEGLLEAASNLVACRFQVLIQTLLALESIIELCEGRCIIPLPSDRVGS